jgi:hypothetical protein
MSRTVSELGIEERIKSLIDELEKIQAVLASLSLSVYPEKLNIENLSVNEINFNLKSLDISELSGVLNIGVNNGVTFSKRRNNNERRAVSKGEQVRKNHNESSPKCNIFFDRR